jgi:hypothetical protein
MMTAIVVIVCLTVGGGAIYMVGHSIGYAKGYITGLRDLDRFTQMAKDTISPDRSYLNERHREEGTL